MGASPPKRRGVTMYEYYLKFWGGAEKRIEEKLGMTTKDFWFSSKQERSKFKEKVNAYAGDQTVVFASYEGEDVRKRTIVMITAEFKGKYYSFEYDFGYAYPIESAEYMFEDGNYSCNCNLSSIIQEKYPEFPKLECLGDDEGNEINYVTFEIELR